MGLVTPTNTASEFQKIQVGLPFTISWSGATGDVTIALLFASGTTVVTIGSALTGTSYVWTPPALSTTDTYTLQFVDATLVTSRSESFNFSEDSVAAARDASSSQVSVLPSTTLSPSLTSTRSQTSSTASTSIPTMSFTPSSILESQIPTSTSTASSSSTNPSSSQERGLSAGAKAGISIGVIVGVLLIISLVIMAFWIGRRSARNDTTNDDRDVNDMEGGGTSRGWPGWEEPKHDPGSTGSRNNLLKRNGDGRSSRMGTMMTDGGSSRMDTATFTDGRSSRMTMTDGRDSRMDTLTPTPMSPLAMSPVDDGRQSRVSVLSDGRTSRIGRFEFEDSTDARGFSGGIRIVEMEDFKI
ncbi:hypothetical protein DL98DRAFT_516833 [Cadophora sp. DSE1049]|nr:hypothetical protein DL98DRAFT_516833 [Cadophora sp. DSE1049]